MLGCKSFLYAYVATLEVYFHEQVLTRVHACIGASIIPSVDSYAVPSSTPFENLHSISFSVMTTRHIACAAVYNTIKIFQH